MKRLASILLTFSFVAFLLGCRSEKINFDQAIWRSAHEIRDMPSSLCLLNSEPFTTIQNSPEIYLEDAIDFLGKNDDYAANLVVVLAMQNLDKGDSLRFLLELKTLALNKKIQSGVLLTAVTPRQEFGLGYASSKSNEVRELAHELIILASELP